MAKLRTEDLAPTTGQLALADRLGVTLPDGCTMAEAERALKAAQDTASESGNEEECRRRGIVLGVKVIFGKDTKAVVRGFTKAGHVKVLKLTGPLAGQACVLNPRSIKKVLKEDKPA
jgi:hypothetical protein